MNSRNVLHPLDSVYQSVNMMLLYVRQVDNGLPESIQRGIAILAVFILSPVFIVTYFLIKLESKGPAVYSQTRVGINGATFTLYKFRSMYVRGDQRYVDPDTLQSDRQGVCKKMFKDPRITKIGKVIRKLSIDEMPQLFNVIKGEMLLIGPRPALPSEVAEYDFVARKRLAVTPGLTGLWQVSGRADTSFEQQINLDNYYIARKSFLLDLRILVMTVPAVLTGKGAY